MTAMQKYLENIEPFSRYRYSKPTHFGRLQVLYIELSIFEIFKNSLESSNICPDPIRDIGELRAGRCPFLTVSSNIRRRRIFRIFVAGKKSFIAPFSWPEKKNIGTFIFLVLPLLMLVWPSIQFSKRQIKISTNPYNIIICAHDDVNRR